MPLLHRNTLPAWVLPFIDRIELALIVAIAVLLPFDHWFFGHLVNPAPTRVLGFILTVIWILQWRARELRFTFEFWHGLVAVFLATCLFSAVASPQIPNPEINNLQYKLVATSKIVTAMLFLIFASSALTLDKIKVFLRVHLVVGVSICVVSLILYVLHLLQIWPTSFALWVDEKAYTSVRIQGVSYEPHRFGAYTMTLLPWLLLPALRRFCGWSDTAAIAAFWVVALCLILSFAIGTYLALPILLLLLACSSQKNFSSMLKAALGLAVILAVISTVPAIYDSALDIIFDKARSQSLSDRLSHWAAALVLTFRFPATGVGPESYSYFLVYFDPRLADATPASNPPQNMLLGIAANTGWPGIVSFMTFQLGFLITYIKRHRQSDGNKSVSYASFSIAFSHFIYQQSIWLPWSLNQWLFMAFAMATLKSGTARPKRHDLPT